MREESVMDAEKMEDLLNTLLCLETHNYAEESLVVDTFEQAGVMTRDRGLVVREVGGSEFQITIVRRK